ncbi:hypothetical protein [Paraburkholderia fungorum]|jgi:hypothetical protein|nr:hypothetical protein [Paraburkholderia fungorum]MBB5544498.1 hypothetical protein [Paraburkholderia fungorum]
MNPKHLTFNTVAFFAAAKKVSAAPHRGNANKPLTKQGKAKDPDQQENRRPGKNLPPAHGKQKNQAEGFL